MPEIPQHLLKKSLSNDSNILNQNFYFELLHIIGLTEEKDEGKRVIVRNPAGRRQPASLIENAMCRLSHDMTGEEALFECALELTITWINRILFLKLLEAQQLRYQGGNSDYAFLNIRTIRNFGWLNTLFFKVLAVEQKNRDDTVNENYKNVPCLDSSLFVKTENEAKHLLVSNLQNEEIDIFPSTVLNDEAGNRRKGKINILEYIFEFLDAYDFSSEGSEEIQEQNKTLINASVLGLIFEKINGYKDGSYFTPGFITSFICSETIKSVVIDKFNAAKGWNVKSLKDLYNKIGTEDSAEANEIINSITILDPAVGSGHFLVSALNEIIAIKSELGVLADKEGKRIKDYLLKVCNDELVIYDDNHRFFEYNYKNEEKQRIQETIFNEKRRIIENSLFGVDLNRNSVKICRLRLWIELLKNAYYTKESGYKELETFPNLDLNIKSGNSLISRFDLHSDLKTNLSGLKYTVGDYFEWRFEFPEVLGPDGKFMGFDAVIGNPPYGILNKKQNKNESIVVPDEELDYYKKNKLYAPAQGGMLNIFRLFIVRSISLLKEGGIFSQIFPLAFTGDISLKNLRKHIFENTQIQFLEVFPERDDTNKRVFEAVKMSTCILNCKKTAQPTNEPFYVRINRDRGIDGLAEKNSLAKNDIQFLQPERLSIPLTIPLETNILRKSYKYGTRFSEIGYCAVGEVDMSSCKPAFTDDNTKAVLLKGAIIDRYLQRKKMSQGEIVFIDEDILRSLKKIDMDMVKGERIVMQGITGVNEKTRIKAMLVKGVYCANSLNFLTLKKALNKKYLLALLNSKLLNFIFIKFNTNSNVNGYEIDNLPIAEAGKETEKKLASLVDKAIAAKKKNPPEDSLVHEKEIDDIVYSLYQLSPEEIELVDRSR